MSVLRTETDRVPGSDFAHSMWHLHSRCLLSFCVMMCNAVVGLDSLDCEVRSPSAAGLLVNAEESLCRGAVVTPV